MRRVILLSGLLLLIFPSTPAQTLSDYLKARKLHHIFQAVGPEALETLLGNHVVEIQGRVKGTMSAPAGNVVLLERIDGGSIYVDCKTIPEWLQGNEVPARLLVLASRPSESARLHAQLIGAAPEDDVARVDAAAEWARRQRLRKSPSRSLPKRPSRSWSLPASEVTPYYQAFIKRRRPSLSDAEALRIAQGIIGFSLQYGVDARLIMAMVMVESGFNPNARSYAGAQGLGQLMPGTAAGMGVNNPYDSIDNLYGTVRLVRGHLEKYKRETGNDYDALVYTLAAYNAGSGAVKRHHGVPPFAETQRYVRTVTALYFKLCGRR